MKVFSALVSCLAPLLGVAAAANSTFYNPAIPGFHPDPSCTQVNGTFFCVSSTFLAFPGLPIHASRDLVNWKLISHAWNRESQLPDFSTTTPDQKHGFWAPTIRYHEGVFYVIVAYRVFDNSFVGTVFKSSDPFDLDAWSDPVIYESQEIDPDLFWDDDGKVWAASGGINIMEIDLETGETTTPIEIYNGTGSWGSIEGPHIYKKDGWYYLLLAEGGTGMDHSAVMARSRNITGPYEGAPHNPVLTARGTENYFQTVGHADLFRDADGNWWGMCLSIRSGREYLNYPMGRESVLFPVRWDEDDWPVFEPIQGRMNGWALPPTDLNLPGEGHFNDDADVHDFPAGSDLPSHFIHWRVRKTGTFDIGDGGLSIVPSRANLTGFWDKTNHSTDLSGEKGISYVGRRQTHSLFSFSIDLSFEPQAVGEEAGVTVFATQFSHYDLGLVLLDDSDSGTPQLSLRFRTIGRRSPPKPSIVPLPETWDANEGIRLQVNSVNETHYEFSAMPASNPNARVIISTASTMHLSGDVSSYIGVQLGAYATCNGAGEGLDCPDGGVAHVKRWRYTPVAQIVSRNGLGIVPVTG